ncbi:MAG: GAF domain-containing protein [Chloroflexi bacterium]|nr:GAF domain-containing protein [Chloroflexota bacterium]
MSNERLHALTWQFLDNVTEGVIITTPDGMVSYVNPAAQTWLGLTTIPRYGSISLAEIMPRLATDFQWQQLLAPVVSTHVFTINGHWQIRATPIKGAEDQFIQINITRNQIAAAAALSPETQTTSIHHLYLLSQSVLSEHNFDKKLQMIVEGLQTSGWQRVTLTLRDPDFTPRGFFSAGLSPQEHVFLQENLLPAPVWQQRFASQQFAHYRQGSAYFIPAEDPWAQANIGVVLPGHEPDHTPFYTNRWHPHDMLLIPLYNQQQEIMALVGLDAPSNGLRPDEFALQTIELYAQFIASVIETGQLLQSALNRTRELSILAEASAAITGSLEQETILSTMGEHLCRATQSVGYTIVEWSREDNQLMVLFDEGQEESEASALQGESFHLNDYASVFRVLTHDERLVFSVPSAELSYLPSAWLKESQTYTLLLLPLTIRGEMFGLIQLGVSGTAAATTPADLQILEAIVNSASIALENALLFDDTYKRELFFTALGRVSLALNATLDLKGVLDLICQESLSIFRLDGVYIWQVEAGQLVGIAAVSEEPESFIGHTISASNDKIFPALVRQKNEALFVNGFDESGPITLGLPTPVHVRAVLGVPLQRDNDIIGVLVLVEKNNPHRFTTQDVQRAAQFGVQAAIAMRNAQLFTELRKLNEELDQRVAERTHDLGEERDRVQILLRISSELAASLDEDRVLTRALELVNEVVNSTQGVILLIDQETGELMFKAALGGRQRDIPTGGLPTGLHRNEGLAGWIIKNQQAVIVNDTLTDDRWVNLPTSQEMRAALGVPLISGDEVIGVLMMFHKEPYSFTQEQLKLVEAAAIQVANAIYNSQLYLLIRDQANKLGNLLREEQIEAAKNQSILESIADGVLVADAEGTILIANEPVSRILDIPRNRLISRSVRSLLGVYGSSGDSWIDRIEDWSQSSDRIRSVPLSYLSDRLEVEDKVVSVNVAPVFAGNQFFGTVSIFRDITKEVEVDRMKSEFVSTVSHELRTPMTSIKGYADLMLMGAAGPMTEPQIRYLEVIKNNADRLRTLVDELLDISRIETGKTELDLRPLDIPQLIHRLLDEHLRGRMMNEGKKMLLSAEVEPGLPLVNADATRAHQILRNLLDNAFNYTPDGGNIQVLARTDDSYVAISVKDSGVGIAKENQNKIFDRFFRAEDTDIQQVPGTGLGLAIVRSLVEMHGGIILVDSDIGHGSTFTFTLPIVVADGEMV